MDVTPSLLSTTDLIILVVGIAAVVGINWLIGMGVYRIFGGK